MSDGDLDLILGEADVLAEGAMLMEGTGALGRVDVPKKGGVIAEDGTVRLSVIRPCVSRGKRLRGLPPIYTPGMLAENAAVFSGWLMYMDHLTEQIVEMLQERGRSITELGGRIIRSWYDPELVFEDDSEYGFQKGGVRAIALPQPPIARMIEADPELLHCSINAYPKSARAGAAPWDSSVKGMIVEGIRATPVGSVDWVPRAGAGGRVLREWEETAVTLLESFYDAPRGRTDKMPEFKNMTREQLAEALRADNPGLAEQLGLSESSGGGGGSSSGGGAPTPAVTGLSEADVTRMLQERDAQWESKLAENEPLSALVEARASELLTEREEARVLERDAARMIDDAGLKPGWVADLKRRWSVLPSGPSAALRQIMEMSGDGEPAGALLTEAVKADITHAQELIAESAGSARPRVRGLGGGGKDGGGKDAPRNTLFRDFVRESGGVGVDDDGKPVKIEEGLRDMVQEGVR